MALTARGPQARTKRKTQPKAATSGKWRVGRSEAEDIRRRRDRLKGHPQELQHSAAVRREAGSSAPGEAFNISCAKDRDRRPRPGIPVSGSAGLGDTRESGWSRA